MSDPAIYQNPLTPQQKTDWHDTSPDTPRTNAARMHTRDLVLEACAMERELADVRAYAGKAKALLTEAYQAVANEHLTALGTRIAKPDSLKARINAFLEQSADCAHETGTKLCDCDPEGACGHPGDRNYRCVKEAIDRGDPDVVDSRHQSGKKWPPLPEGDVPDHQNIADMLPSMLVEANARCPLCGQQGAHPHSPAEIVIYRNGVKYGRMLVGECHQVGRDVPESGSTLDLRLVEAAWHLSQSNHPVSAAAVREAHDKIFGPQEDARDAARYRWWRKWWCDNGDDCERVNSLEYDTDEPATFDAAIDAEIRADDSQFVACNKQEAAK